MPPAGFEPTIPASERPQTHAVDCAANGIGSSSMIGVQKYQCVRCCVGRDSVVGIATCYGLDGPGIESRWGGARFSAPVQTGPGVHPASCTTGTGSLSRGKATGAWRLPPTPSSAEVKEKSRAVPLLSLWAFVACFRVTFNFNMT
jgi:hypothetical protein